MWVGTAAVLALAAAAVLALGVYAAHRVFSTQCFSHHVPEFPNHGLSAVREAAPAGLAAADALLKLHLQHGEPLILRNGSGMQGWNAEACWTPACVRRRFGEQPVDSGGASSAPLARWLDEFFDGGRGTPHDGLDTTQAAAGCFGGSAGRSHCTVNEGGAPFCAAPCFVNATINFGLHPYSENFIAWEDALSSTGWFPLQRRRALKGNSWAAWATTTVFPPRYGFDPGVDWVEGVLWLSPKGARTGRVATNLYCCNVHALIRYAFDKAGSAN